MRHGHPKTDRAPVILHVQCVVLETECLRELTDDRRVVIKRVRERPGVRPVAVAESRIIRCDKVILIGQPCEERLETCATTTASRAARAASLRPSDPLLGKRLSAHRPESFDSRCDAPRAIPLL